LRFKYRTHGDDSNKQAVALRHPLAAFLESYMLKGRFGFEVPYREL
jgi:hypothetical protein